MRHLWHLLLACSLTAGCVHSPQPAREPVRRVVLVHGFLENGSSFKSLQRRLARHHVQCLVPQLNPCDGRGGLEALAGDLKRDIDRAFGPDARISIVSFSMGGLISRYYLQNLGGAARCDQLITIATPHHGTEAAWYYPSKGTVQMRPQSAFLADLDKTVSRLGTMPVVSYRTPMDLVIMPPESSIWDRAINLEYRVLTHHLMLTSGPVLDDIERRLLSQTDVNSGSYRNARALQPSPAPRRDDENPGVRHSQSSGR